MLARLASQWVYGGALAGVLLLVLAPLLTPSLNGAGDLVYLSLIAYMLHQYEEHDADRFRLFVNKTAAAGRAGLSHLDVFIINIPGVWGVMAIALWLSERLAPGWAMLASWLLLINALAHVLPAIGTRHANPGLWTAIFMFIPLGAWMLIHLWPVTTTSEQATCLGIAVLIHVAIMVRALRPLPDQGKGLEGRRAPDSGSLG